MIPRTGWRESDPDARPRSVSCQGLGLMQAQSGSLLEMELSVVSTRG